MRAATDMLLSSAMRTIYNDQHRLHISPGEFDFGQFVPAFEKPERVDMVLRRLRETGLGAIDPPQSFPLDCLAAVHAPALLSFLEGAHAEWAGLHRPGAAYPLSWAGGGMRRDKTGGGVDTKLARHCFDAATPITATTWRAVKASADCALSAAALVAGGERSAFALCRPPGHHAGFDFYGGYCFLNNAAIAAQYLRGSGAGKVAIVDVDYHHGNGTQNIFYERPDIFYVSIHADPDFEFPFLAGYADETGAGAGQGANLNFPLPAGTGWEPWGETLQRALAAVSRFAPDAIVVSLGVDTFKGDPVAQFRLESEHFLRIGERLEALKLPTLFVMEGGYAVDELGINTVNVLQGFEGA
jgi:acetoin utilization deacetylase AcuC-like enzyme